MTILVVVMVLVSVLVVVVVVVVMVPTRPPNTYPVDVINIFLSAIRGGRLPEFNPVGKLKDVLFPQPRMDFYAVVRHRWQQTARSLSCITRATN